MTMLADQSILACDPLLSRRSSFTDTFSRQEAAQHLRQRALWHRCASHPLFEKLDNVTLTAAMAARLLRNYDAHASALRRLLLLAATIMPEEAVTYVLENVRNEYGNGNPDNRHQLQLIDVAMQAGATREMFDCATIESGVKEYIEAIKPFYYPLAAPHLDGFLRPAIASGAITATEILALEEFKHLQNAFSRLGLAHHIWFDHVTVEMEHADESLALALHFIEHYGAVNEVEHGLDAVLNANLSLYDGLLAALSR